MNNPLNTVPNPIDAIPRKRKTQVGDIWVASERSIPVSGIRMSSGVPSGGGGGANVGGGVGVLGGDHSFEFPLTNPGNHVWVFWMEINGTQTTWTVNLDITLRTSLF